MLAPPLNNFPEIFRFQLKVNKDLKTSHTEDVAMNAWIHLAVFSLGTGLTLALFTPPWQTFIVLAAVFTILAQIPPSLLTDTLPQLKGRQ